MAETPVSVSAEQVLRNLLCVVDVTIPDSGLCKDKMVLWFRMGSMEPNQGYGLAVAANSYDEASLNAIWDVLNQARSVLGLPINDTPRDGAFLVHSVPQHPPPA